MSSGVDLRWRMVLAAMCGLAGGVLLMIGIIVYKKTDLSPRVVIQPQPMPEPVDADSASDVIAAWAMTRYLIEQNLPGASSGEWGGTFADYQDPRQVVSDHGHGRYSVHAWVDALNNFGVPHRYNFVCDLEYEGNNHWHCSGLHFN